MCKNVLMKVIAASLITIGNASLLIGCAEQPVQYASSPSRLPIRPLLPALTENDVQCLSNEAYKKLVNRDLFRKQYAEELEVIIESTHSNKNE
jgi:hypothetical protein